MSSSAGQTQGSFGGQSQNLQGTIGQSQTGTPDPVFNVVSVLYHALEGASNVQKYIGDAQQSGDNELVQFFQQVQQQNKQLADKAKQLLGQRLTSSTKTPTA